jgi:hypothetical protein
LSDNLTIDYVLSSRLLKAALRSSCLQTQEGIMVSEILRYLLERIDQLARNVQYSEFTEHGLPHIRSLVNRISEWTLATTDENKQRYLVDSLTADESFLLAFATFTHDIGMLSQSLDDLPTEKRYSLAPLSVDLPLWVRKTHTVRLRKLVCRLLSDNIDLAHFAKMPSTSILNAGILLAESHSEWPKDDKDDTDSDGPIYRALLSYSQQSEVYTFNRLKGLAAVLAVSDLLDEDNHRCETDALLGHKQASTLNRSHWLRHLLVTSPPIIKDNKVKIRIAPIEIWQKRLSATMKALKEYLREAEVRYNGNLSYLNASISITFDPKGPGSDLKLNNLKYFDQVPDTHLLRSFPSNVVSGLIAKTCEDSPEQNSFDHDSVSAQQVLNALPTDHDSIITLRAAKALRDVGAITACKDLVRHDAMIARERGEIALALKLSREYKHEQ